MAEASKETLQERWNYLYKEYLPALAKARDEAQPKWPVNLDHCFARIVLDNSVGVDKPWTEVVKSPAYKNMSETQLKGAIALAEKIANGEANLVELDEQSLQLRGKKSKKRKAANGKSEEAEAEVKVPATKKRKSDQTVSSYFLPATNSASTKIKNSKDEAAPDAAVGKTEDDVDMSVQVKRIQDSNMTAFKKQILTMLTHIPRGRYSTYGAMSDHLSKTSSKTCARAVGSAIKNNPFAPEVPCHRILAADGTLGGFKSGGWGESGKYANEKHKLLKEEGVKFDSSMKVKGPPFTDFGT
ncbi:Putative methylated-DNA-[protein]-cysteine S-methyltransferase, active [Septoria linicola]|uniref:Methylated-DNA--protein-cysteine methyltransferase n=1 Tax=Septoria linicola TaxID=215465 RepID=A0A9Q9ASZ0_9PEZI|nr:putative methylated-DNA-[protein]-cysteine S-methyltransferase, active [Septoria linicola]USW51568.1 Putative methylated-DNA-[protein]-cysteine S-methyltransferase, active [Septoria linicola]